MPRCSFRWSVLRSEQSPSESGSVSLSLTSRSAAFKEPLGLEQPRDPTVSMTSTAQEAEDGDESVDDGLIC